MQWTIRAFFILIKVHAMENLTVVEIDGVHVDNGVDKRHTSVTWEHEDLAQVNSV